MSKRFTATEKWDKPWHRRLPPPVKCLWDYMLAKCDIAGIWEPDFGLASYQIGADVTEADLEWFGNRIRELPSGKIIIVSFVRFQYGFLHEKAPVHVKVIERLNREGVDYHQLCEWDTLPATLPGTPPGTLGPNGVRTLQEEEEEQVKEEEAEGVPPSLKPRAWSARSRV